MLVVIVRIAYINNSISHFWGLIISQTASSAFYTQCSMCWLEGLWEALAVMSYITADSVPRDSEPVAEAELSRVTCSAIIQNNLTVLQIRDKLHKYGIGSSAWWPSSYHKQPSNGTKCLKLHLFVNSESLWLSWRKWAKWVLLPPWLPPECTCWCCSDGESKQSIRQHLKAAPDYTCIWDHTLSKKEREKASP